MKNQINVEYKIPFMEFEGKCHKHDRQHFSYIRTNKHTWLVGSLAVQG